MAAKKKSLVKEGHGNKPNASRELTDGEEVNLFEILKSPSTGIAGHPVVVLSMQFGFRARDEIRKLCWGDKVLEWTPRPPVRC